MTDIMKVIEPVMSEAMEEESRETALTCVSVILLATARPQNVAEWAYQILKTAFKLNDEQIKESAVRTSLMLGSVLKLDTYSPELEPELRKVIDVLMLRVERINKQEAAVAASTTGA